MTYAFVISEQPLSEYLRLAGPDGRCQSTAAVHCTRFGSADPSVPGQLADRSAAHERAFVSAVMIAYLAIGVFAFWPDLPGSASRLFGSHTPDAGRWHDFSLDGSHTLSFTAKTLSLATPC